MIVVYLPTVCYESRDSEQPGINCVLKVETAISEYKPVVKCYPLCNHINFLFFYDILLQEIDIIIKLHALAVYLVSRLKYLLQNCLIANYI